MSFKNDWTISSSYDFQVPQQRSQRRCFSQTALLWFEVLPAMLLALPGARRLVVGAPSYSESWQECPLRVWYSLEIDASKFTLHILWDTPGGFQPLKYILLMWNAIDMSCFVCRILAMSLQFSGVKSKSRSDLTSWRTLWRWTIWSINMLAKGGASIGSLEARQQSLFVMWSTNVRMQSWPLP